MIRLKFQSTIVNQALLSLHGGSLIITLTIPLKRLFKEFQSKEKYFFLNVGFQIGLFSLDLPVTFRDLPTRFILKRFQQRLLLRALLILHYRQAYKFLRFVLHKYGNITNYIFQINIKYNLKSKLNKLIS